MCSLLSGWLPDLLGGLQVNHLCILLRGLLDLLGGLWFGHLGSGLLVGLLRNGNLQDGSWLRVDSMYSILRGLWLRLFLVDLCASLLVNWLALCGLLVSWYAWILFAGWFVYL